MVLSNAPKIVNRISSLVNKNNTCGGDKKSGLSSSTGFVLQSNRRLKGASNKIEKNCVVGRNLNPSQSVIRAIHRY